MSEDESNNKPSDMGKARGKKAVAKAAAEDRPPGVDEAITNIKPFVDLFTDVDGKHYASVRLPEKPPATFALRSPGFAAECRAICEHLLKMRLRVNHVKEIVSWFESIAQRSGVRREAALRYAKHEGSIYVDTIGNGYIKISPEGIETVAHVDAVFRRPVTSVGMGALSEEAATVDEFCEAFGVSQDVGLLMLAWCVAACFPGQPCPILVFNAARGTAKSTKSECLRELIDPDTIPHTQLQSDLRSLAIGISATRVWMGDNISELSAEQSDLLCRASTGGAFAVRALHTDSDQAIMSLQRAIVLNGLAASSERPDLQSRMIVIALPEIRKFVPHAVVMARFRAAAPRLRRLIYNGVQAALSAPPWDPESETADSRLADFSALVSGAESGLGVKPGTIAALLTSSALDVARETIEHSAITGLIVRLLTLKLHGVPGRSLTCRPAELLEMLTPLDTRKDLPKSSYQLGTELLRLQGTLALAGVKHEKRRTEKGFFYSLTVLDSFVLASPQHNSYGENSNDFQEAAHPL